jgi:hypothetical protein
VTNNTAPREATLSPLPLAELLPKGELGAKPSNGKLTKSARGQRLACIQDVIHILHVKHGTMDTVHTVKGLIRSIRWTIQSGPEFRHFFHTVARGPGGPRRCQVF